MGSVVPSFFTPMASYGLWSTKSQELQIQIRSAERITVPIPKNTIGSKFPPWGYILIALIVIVLALHGSRKYKKAIKVYEKTIEITPESADDWYNKGQSLQSSGKYEEAMKAYDRAIEITPEYASAWYNKGFDLYKLGEYEEARKSYDKAREIIHRGSGYEKGEKE